jgi:cob(I)alamin adenosyltransferase
MAAAVERDGVRNMRGFILVYTGNGKGKTTAAFGLAIRTAGAGMNVFIGQFLKSGRYSEVSALERFPERITCRQYGSGCRVDGNVSEADSRLARCGLEAVRWVTARGRYRLVILDEINIAVSFGLLTVEDLLELIEIKPAHVELVFTGRYAPSELIERSDLCTEMREVKHYYQNGVLARKGIEC